MKHMGDSRDVMNMLNNDELGLILKWVDDPFDLQDASLVCKQWLRVEGQTRSSIIVKNLDLLPRLLARFPNLVAFETRQPITDANQLKLVAKGCPKLKTFILDIVWFKDLYVPSGGGLLSRDEILRSDELMKRASVVGSEGLCAIANGCPKLSKIVLRQRRVGMLGIEALIASAAHNLSHLDLSLCDSVSDQVLEAIGSSMCPIRFLKVTCTRITDVGLVFLADGSCSKTIKHLNLRSCKEITDFGVSLLHKMRVLNELRLGGCRNLTDVGGVAISAVPTLKKLDLSMTFQITVLTIGALVKNCLNLKMLNLSWSKCVLTGADIQSFSGHKHLEFLNLASCLDEISIYDLESLVLGCSSLRAIYVEDGLRERLLDELQESAASRLVRHRATWMFLF